MTKKSLCAGLALILSSGILTTVDNAFSQSRGTPASLESVEFIGMDAPDTPEERAQSYTEASVVLHLSNGRAVVYPLQYHVLHYNTTEIGASVGLKF